MSSKNPFLKIIALTLVVTFSYTSSVGYTDFPSNFSTALKNSEIYHVRANEAVNSGLIDDYLVAEGLELPAHLMISNDEPALAKSELRYTERSKISKQATNITFVVNGAVNTYNQHATYQPSLRSVVKDVLNTVKQREQVSPLIPNPFSNFRIAAILINGNDISIGTHWLETNASIRSLDESLRTKTISSGDKVEIQIETRASSELRQEQPKPSSVGDKIAGFIEAAISIGFATVVFGAAAGAALIKLNASSYLTVGIVSVVMVLSAYGFARLWKHEQAIRDQAEKMADEDQARSELRHEYSQIRELAKNDPELFAMLVREADRQQNTLTLIASETHTPDWVLGPLGHPANDKYLEGYPGARYYGGNGIADEIENLARQRWLKAAAEIYPNIENEYGVNVQPHSGSSANLAVLVAALKSGDKIMGLKLAHGGHLTHGQKVNVSGKFFDSVLFGVDEATGKIDYNKLEEQALKELPRMMVIGTTGYTQQIDWKRMREITDKVTAERQKGENASTESPTLLLADVAHNWTQILAGDYNSPFGLADFVTLTPHKSRGPRSGLIYARKVVYPTLNARQGVLKSKIETATLADLVDSAIIPGTQGGPKLADIASKAAQALYFLSPEFRAYAKQIRLNAQALADELAKQGAKLVSDGTDVHLVLVDTRGAYGIMGLQAQEALESVGIVNNRNGIPVNEAAEAAITDKEVKQTPFKPAGIRLGVFGMTARGMKEGDVRKVAEIIHYALSNADKKTGEVPNELKQLAQQEIAELTRRFPVHAEYRAMLHQIAKATERIQTTLETDEGQQFIVIRSSDQVLRAKVSTSNPLETAKAVGEILKSIGFDVNALNESTATLTISKPGSIMHPIYFSSGVEAAVSQLNFAFNHSSSRSELRKVFYLLVVPASIATFWGFAAYYLTPKLAFISATPLKASLWVGFVTGFLGLTAASLANARSTKDRNDSQRSELRVLYREDITKGARLLQSVGVGMIPGITVGMSLASIGVLSTVMSTVVGVAAGVLTAALVYWRLTRQMQVSENLYRQFEIGRRDGGSDKPAALERGHVIANQIMVSGHLALVPSLFSLSHISTYTGPQVIQFIFASWDTLVSGIFWYASFHINVWWHERAHFWEAVRQLTLRKDVLDKVQDIEKLPLWNPKRAKVEFDMFLKAPYGKFAGIKYDKLSYYVDAPHNPVVTAAGPLKSGQLAYVLLPIAAAAIGFGYAFVFESLILLGRFLLPIGTVALFDRLLADHGAVKKLRERERMAEEASKKVATAGSEDAWLNRAPAVKERMRTTRMRKVVRPDGTEVNVPWGYRNSAMGGAHTEKEYPESNISLQEGMFIPLSATSIEEGQEMTVALQNRLKEIIEKTPGSRVMGIGLEGGLAPYVTPDEGDTVPELKLWRMMTQAIKDLGYKPGVDVALALDAAASELENAYRDEKNPDAIGQYLFWRDKAKVIMTREELLALYKRAMDEGIPFVSIEDAFSERDDEGFALFQKEFGDKIWRIGDDLVTTNDRVVEEKADKGLLNALLTKYNQIGTLSETILAMLTALGNGLELVISHRSKSPNDDGEAQVAMASFAMGLKAGGGANTERLVKYQAIAKMVQEALTSKGATQAEVADQAVDSLIDQLAVTNVTAYEEPTNAGVPTVGIEVIVGIKNHPKFSSLLRFTGSTPLGTSAGTLEAIHLVDSIIEKSALTEKYADLFKYDQDGQNYQFKKGIKKEDIAAKNDAELLKLWNQAQRYGGKGTQNAVQNVLDIIKPQIIGKKASDLGNLSEIDHLLLSLELETAKARGKDVGNSIYVMQRKGNVGMNAILSTSLALARFISGVQGKHLWETVRETMVDTMKKTIKAEIGEDVNVEGNTQEEWDQLVAKLREVKAKLKSEGKPLYEALRKQLPVYETEQRANRAELRFSENIVAAHDLDGAIGRHIWIKEPHEISLAINLDLNRKFESQDARPSSVGFVLENGPTNWNREEALILRVYASDLQKDDAKHQIAAYLIKKPHSGPESHFSNLASKLNLGPQVLIANNDFILEELFNPENALRERGPKLPAVEAKLVGEKLAEAAYKMYIQPDARKAAHALDGYPNHIFIVGEGDKINVKFVDWARARDLSGSVFDFVEKNHLRTLINIAASDFGHTGNGHAAALAGFLSKLTELAASNPEVLQALTEIRQELTDRNGPGFAQKSLADRIAPVFEAADSIIEKFEERSELRQVSHVTITEINYSTPLPAGINEQHALAEAQRVVKEAKTKNPNAPIVIAGIKEGAFKGFTYRVETKPESPDLVEFDLSRLEQQDQVTGQEGNVKYVTGRATLTRSELRQSVVQDEVDAAVIRLWEKYQRQQGIHFDHLSENAFVSGLNAEDIAREIETQGFNDVTVTTDQVNAGIRFFNNNIAAAADLQSSVVQGGKSELRASRFSEDDFNSIVTNVLAPNEAARVIAAVQAGKSSLNFPGFDDVVPAVVAILDVFKRAKTDVVLGSILTRDLIFSESDAEGRALLWALPIIAANTSDPIALVADGAGRIAIQEALKGIKADHIVVAKSYPDALRKLGALGARDFRIIASENERASKDLLTRRYAEKVIFISRNNIGALFKVFGVEKVAQTLTIQLNERLAALRSA